MQDSVHKVEWWTITTLQAEATFSQGNEVRSTAYRITPRKCSLCLQGRRLQKFLDYQILCWYISFSQISLYEGFLKESIVLMPFYCPRRGFAQKAKSRGDALVTLRISMKIGTRNSWNIQSVCQKTSRFDWTGNAWNLCVMVTFLFFAPASKRRLEWRTTDEIPKGKLR